MFYQRDSSLFLLDCADCSTPVGVEGGKISDQQMSASSHWNQHYGSNGRLNNQARDDGSGLTWGGWCTDQLDKNQYLQVSVSKKRPCYAKKKKKNQSVANNHKHCA